MSEQQGQGDSGLAAIVAGTGGESGGHLILADWLEEKLGLKNLADALRGSADDPRNPDDEGQERTSFSGFRWRQLDPRVLLYMAEYRVWRPFKRGQPAQHLEGQILGLYLAADSPVGQWRWVRWLPSGASSKSAGALWEELGADAPARVGDDR
jgi:hypothetical protein